jgi:glycosyltransferase involved in cell wall biosynthesis
MNKAKKNILFVTWDGPQTNYLESLFVPIFIKLRNLGYDFYIIQFTWGDDKSILSKRISCENNKFEYRNVIIFRKYIAFGSLLTALNGIQQVYKAIKDFEIDIVMARSLLPALSTIFALKLRSSVSLIWDSDGLPHDERIEYNGLSSSGLTYRILRKIEKYSIRKAKVILTRSKKAIDILIDRSEIKIDKNKFIVVSNGRDESVFSPKSLTDNINSRLKIGVNSRVPLIVFVGSSMSEKYCGKEILEFFSLVYEKRKDARLLLIISIPNEAEILLKDYEQLRKNINIMSVAAKEVPYYLSACDLGLAIIRPTFSMQAASAIKLGEYLLCGIPVLTTIGIGDSEDIVNEKVGYLINTLSKKELELAAEWFLKDIISRSSEYKVACRNAGLEYFGLENTVQKYEEAIKYI